MRHPARRALGQEGRASPAVAWLVNETGVRGYEILGISVRLLTERVISMSLAALAVISLGFVDLPGTPMQWMWGFVGVSVAFMAFGQAMNGLAGMFTECPHCHKVVRKVQTVCNHCMKPVGDAAPPTRAEGKVQRAKSGRLPKSKTSKL